MIYLKLFKESLIPDVTETKYNLFRLERNIIPFTTKEIDFIEKLLQDKLLVIMDEKSPLNFNNGRYQFYYQTNEYKVVYVTKHIDEWWTVDEINQLNNKRKYYICDQFDELLQLLVNI